MRWILQPNNRPLASDCTNGDLRGGLTAKVTIKSFRFHGGENPRLGEVLVYPGTFDENYQTTGSDEKSMLGMVGLNHFRGVMIPSERALPAGFDNASGSAKVGGHEFAQFVENEEEDHGQSAEVPWQAVRQ